MIYRRNTSSNSSNFYTEQALDNNFHHLEDRIQVLENRVQYLEHRLHYKSVIRAQRAAGGEVTNPDKWLFTTLEGNATASFSATPRADTGIIEFPISQPCIIFTFSGFLRFPTQINVLQAEANDWNGRVYSPAGNPRASAGNIVSPNIITSFDPNLHKMFWMANDGPAAGIGEYDWYFEFRE